MPGLDATVGKEAPIVFLVLSFVLIVGYFGFRAAARIMGQAIEFIKARDTAFLDALNKLSADLQQEQADRTAAHQKFMEDQNAMWRGFVKDQWQLMAKSLDGVAEQILQLGQKMDQHDRRTNTEHRPKREP